MSQIGSLGERLLEAFGWAGKNGQTSRLHAITDDLLRRGYAGEALARALIEATDDDPALTNEILDEIGFRRALMARYGERRAAMLRGQGERLPKRSERTETGGNAAPGGGHFPVESQQNTAPTQPHKTGANGARDDAGGHVDPDSQNGLAPASSTDSGRAPDGAGTGRDMSDRQWENARPAPTPSKRGKRALDLSQQALMDVYKSDFGCLRNHRKTQLLAVARRHREDDAWLTALALQLPDDSLTVGDCFDDAEVKRLRQQTREAVDAGR